MSLLTSADTDIATMAAELLFVLCKHNVGKLVKQVTFHISNSCSGFETSKLYLDYSNFSS